MAYLGPMRSFAVIPLALVTAGCLAPGERNPARYPWDRPKPRAAFCIVALEPTAATGIVLKGSAVQPACNPPQRRRRK